MAHKRANFHISNIQVPSYIELPIDPMYFILYSTSNFLGYRNDKICNQQWFEIEWRMLKMTHKWAFYSCTQYLALVTHKENELPLFVL